MLDKIIATFCILLICYEGACIGKARTDVVRLKVGVVAEYFLRRCALLQQRQYGLHLDASPRTTCLPPKMFGSITIRSSRVIARVYPSALEVG